VIESSQWQPYAGAPQVQRLQFRDPAHVPYNKRPGQVESVGTLTFSRNAVTGWVEVQAEETTTGDSGRPVSRSIMLTLPAEEVAKLLSFLLFGNTSGKPGEG
jgi:hypothetical protein